MKQGTINILLVIIIFCISLSANLVKLTDAPATIIVMYRTFLACILLLPVVWKYRKTIFQINHREWLAIFFAGLFLAIHFSLWFESLNHTTVASSTLILALQPTVALIGGLFFFKEKLDIRIIAAMGIAFVGVVIVGGGNLGLGKAVLFGNILSFLSVIAIVLYLFIGQRNVKAVNHWIYSFFVFLSTGIITFVINAAAGVSFTGYASNDWTVFLLLAIFPTGAHIIFNILLKYVNTTTVSMSTLGEPIGASILAVFLLNEMITPVEMIGGVLIIAGIFSFLRVQGGSKQVVPADSE